MYYFFNLEYKLRLNVKPLEDNYLIIYLTFLLKTCSNISQKWLPPVITNPGYNERIRSVPSCYLVITEFDWFFIFKKSKLLR